MSGPEEPREKKGNRPFSNANVTGLLGGGGGGRGAGSGLGRFALLKVRLINVVGLGCWLLLLALLLEEEIGSSASAHQPDRHRPHVERDGKHSRNEEKARSSNCSSSSKCSTSSRRDPQHAPPSPSASPPPPVYLGSSTHDHVETNAHARFQPHTTTRAEEAHDDDRGPEACRAQACQPSLDQEGEERGGRLASHRSS